MRKLLRKRPTIGVVSGWQTYTGTIHSFLDRVYRGIYAASQDLDCNLVIGCGVSSTYLGTSYTALPISGLPWVDFVPVGPWNTDGLIICAPIFMEEGIRFFEDLIASGFPVVYGGDREPGPAVNVDNEGGILQAVEHLVGHGHRQIAFISGHDSPHGDSAARLRGYARGLQQNGILYNPELVASGGHTLGGGFQAMNEILRREKPFTAVIASNDESAAGAMDALRDAGLIVPTDVAVIGFDDRLESRAQIPLLTTIHHPMFELGYQSAELLYQIITEKAPPDSLRTIPTHLVVRESCGCLPGTSTGTSSGQSLPAPANTANNPARLSPSHGPLTVSYAPRYAFATPIDPTAEIVQAMAEAAYKEMQRLSRREVQYLCSRLLEAFKLSLSYDSATPFRLAVQQILEHSAAVSDDVYSWQGAITVLSDWAPALQNLLPNSLPRDQVDHMLQQARTAVSEVLRGQYSRLQVRQAEITNQLGLMTSRFLTAQTEAEVFEILNQSLPPLGMAQPTIAFYEPEGDDPVAWIDIKTPRFLSSPEQRFPTRQFPPPGLYPEEHPYQLLVLPMISQEGMLGFASFGMAVPDPLGTIVRQLVAALHSVRLYQEAVEARQQAEQARQLAEEANSLKSRFLSVVSHELRTPLNLIIGLSNMMLGDSLSDSLDDSHGDSFGENANPDSETPDCLVNRKDLERIYIGAQHLESLIRDVLDLSRSDVGQLKLVCEPIDLGPVLQSAAVIGEQLARDKELNWKAEIPLVLPIVCGDRTRLRQVILNLINNAVKFTASGCITLSARVSDGRITIAISDTGLGIPLDEQDIIFDEFRQSKRTTARGFGGLGLGLAICKRLIEMHQGEIGVTSSGEEGAGSTFYFTLPVVDSELPSSSSVEDTQRSQRVLLLVKDTATSQPLKSYLTQQGFLVDIHPVSEGDDWLAWLRPTLPNQIILDLGITSERGWEILKIIKENQATRDIPVLFYTLESEHDSGALLDLNILTKPINTAELAEELVAQGLIEEENISGQERSILVVDDDPGILNLHARILESMATGYRILQATNGRDALKIIREMRPALVLLDLMMPEVDGFTVLETMQAEELLRSIPVMVVTGQVLTEEDMARLNCGVVSVLNKGMFNAQETLEHITAALSRKRRPGTETQRLVFKAMTFIHAHYKDDISRGDVASFVGVSERHLARCFQQEIGLAPIAYLNRFRVQVAKMLLRSGSMSVTEVAMEVGFSTGGYFTRVFRDEEGISPREYQHKQDCG